MGIGLGIVVGGQVLRGSNGAAGELARLPYPWEDGREPRREALEEYIGSRSLLRRAKEAWQASDGPCPRTTERLFALAGAGTATAGGIGVPQRGDVGPPAAAGAWPRRGGACPAPGRRGVPPNRGSLKGRANPRGGGPRQSGPRLGDRLAAAEGRRR